MQVSVSTITSCSKHVFLTTYRLRCISFVSKCRSGRIFRLCLGTLKEIIPLRLELGADMAGIQERGMTFNLERFACSEYLLYYRCIPFCTLTTRFLFAHSRVDPSPAAVGTPPWMGSFQPQIPIWFGCDGGNRVAISGQVGGRLNGLPNPSTTSYWAKWELKFWYRFYDLKIHIYCKHKWGNNGSKSEKKPSLK